MDNVDIITVTYGNMFDALKRAVDSILRHTPKPFRIIIVNNGSTDQTAEYFSNHPDCVLINMSSNEGTLRGLNAALEMVSAPYTVRMDHDIEIQTFWKDEFMKILESDSHAALVGPKVLTPDGRIYSACFKFYLKKFPALKIKNILQVPRILRPLFYWEFNHFNRDSEELSVTEDVAHVPGTFFMVKTPLLRGLGGFNEDYKELNGTMEDLDLTLRLLSSGYRVIYHGAVGVIHYCDRPVAAVKQDEASLPYSNRRLLRRKWGI